jgi:glycosyltransferase involved in cell wall biosynthesis
MISVIIPLYNAENTILAALDSVKNQEGNFDFEILVINDGSKDKSEILVRNFQKDNPDLKIELINQKNGGVSVARNTGMKNSKGNYIAFLDADDVWLPQKTERQLKFLINENDKIDFITSLRNGEKIWFPYSISKNNLAKITLCKLLLRIEGQTSTAIFKKKIIENTGFFDENQKYSEDANYWMRISKNNNMYILAEDLVFTGAGKKSYGESGLSANLQEMEKGIQKNIKEMYVTKRINFMQYFFFLLFSKLKYVVRIFKNKL